jgi:hypothetical protein
MSIRPVGRLYSIACPPGLFLQMGLFKRPRTVFHKYLKTPETCPPIYSAATIPIFTLPPGFHPPEINIFVNLKKGY